MPEARVIQLHSAESIAQSAAGKDRESESGTGPSARVDPIDRKTRAAAPRARTGANASPNDTGAAAAGSSVETDVAEPQDNAAFDAETRTPHTRAAQTRAAQARSAQARAAQEAQATQDAVAESAAHHPSAQADPAAAVDGVGTAAIDTNGETVSLPDVTLGQAEILERYDEAVARWAHALGTSEVEALLADAEPELAAAQSAASAPTTTQTPPMSPVERKIASGLAFLRRRVTGDYEVDEFGFDRDLVEHVVAPGFTPIYKKWFRTEVLGADNIPTDGGALLVANHAGGIWALDGAITTLAIYRNTPNRRVLRMLGADLVFTTPGLAPFARKSGATLACNADAERLLDRGELVGVWPEGFKGIGKPFSERYKLQRFGRGGFVTAALRAGVPIIPISIVGSEEIHPVLGNAKTLARLLNVPYFPITPTFPWLGPLGLVPFPSKWYIEFGEPIPTSHYGPEGADDPMLVFELTDRVRETIQSTLYRLLVKRRSVWR